jgi:hypothetical protein
MSGTQSIAASSPTIRSKTSIGSVARQVGSMRAEARACARSVRRRSRARSKATRPLGKASRALSHCRAASVKLWRLRYCQAAAIAVRHVVIAAARSVRCVWAEVRWRWRLNVLLTAACVERNFWAEPAASFAPAVASADANSPLDCSSIVRAHAGVRSQGLGPRRCIIASRR